MNDDVKTSYLVELKESAGKIMTLSWDKGLDYHRERRDQLRKLGKHDAADYHERSIRSLLRYLADASLSLLHER